MYIVSPGCTPVASSSTVSGVRSYFVATTPLGGPVVPEVYISPTPPVGSSRSTCGSVSLPDSSRSMSQSTPPPGRPSQTTRWRSVGRSGATDRTASRRSSWNTAVVASESARMCASVAPRWEMLTGTECAPIMRMPRCVQMNSGRFGSISATRSPGRTPSSSRPLAARWAADSTSRHEISSSCHFSQVWSGCSATRARISSSTLPCARAIAASSIGPRRGFERGTRPAS